MQEPTTFYHGTKEATWELIQKEGVLFGRSKCWSEGIGWHEGRRYTYLTPCRDVADKYGPVLLEVQYKVVGCGRKLNGVVYDNYAIDRPEGTVCWQFSVFVPIPLSDVKRVK